MPVITRKMAQQSVNLEPPSETFAAAEPSDSRQVKNLSSRKAKGGNGPDGTTRRSGAASKPVTGQHTKRRAAKKVQRKTKTNTSDRHRATPEATASQLRQQTEQTDEPPVGSRKRRLISDNSDRSPKRRRRGPDTEDAPPTRGGPIYRLPQELIERVLDFLCYNTLSLKACALVHSRWVNRARYHLFRRVYLKDSWRCSLERNIYPFLRSRRAPPVILSSIRYISLAASGNSINLKTFARAMSSLPNLEDLELERVRIHYDDFDDYKRRIRRARPHPIKFLTFNNMSLSATAFATLLSFFPPTALMTFSNGADITGNLKDMHWSNEILEGLKLVKPWLIILGVSLTSHRVSDITDLFQMCELIKSNIRALCLKADSAVQAFARDYWTIDVAPRLMHVYLDLHDYSLPQEEWLGSGLGIKYLRRVSWLRFDFECTETSPRLLDTILQEVFFHRDADSPPLELNLGILSPRDIAPAVLEPILLSYVERYPLLRVVLALRGSWIPFPRVYGHYPHYYTTRPMATVKTFPELEESIRNNFPQLVERGVLTW